MHTPPQPLPAPLFAQVRPLIHAARQRMADYLALLPPRETLQAKRNQSIAIGSNTPCLTNPTAAYSNTA